MYVLYIACTQEYVAGLAIAGSRNIRFLLSTSDTCPVLRSALLNRKPCTLQTAPKDSQYGSG